MVLSRRVLSSGVQKNLGILRRGIREGLTSTAMNAVIKQSQGVGLRRTDLLAGIRHIKGIEEAGSRIRNMRPDLMPDPDRIPYAKTPILSKYSFTIEVRGIDKNTGLRGTTALTIRTNTLMTRNEIEAEAQEAIDEAEDTGAAYKHFEVESILIVDARRRE